MAKLTKRQLEMARQRAVQAALLGVRKRGAIHYTQRSSRWSGIDRKRKSKEGEFPPYADCSAFATWCLWNALHVSYRVRDVVNGAGWRGGFTGSQIAHGRRVSPSKIGRGDLVFYATSGSRPTHVAICVGKQRGRAMVVSHGNESGPLYLPWNYRRYVQIRRYIHDGV